MNSAIYDGKGIKIAGAANLPAELPSEILFSQLPNYVDGLLYFRQDDGTVSAVSMDELTANQIIQRDRAVSQPSVERLFKAVLQNNIVLDDIINLSRKLHIRLDERRSVICIMPQRQVTPDMCHTLSEIFSEEDSVVLQLNDSEIAMVSSTIPDTDLLDTASALRETFLTEFNTDAHVGIGESVGNLVGIASARRTAIDAITIGRRLSFDGGVWQYNRMLPEMLLASIGEEMLLKHSELIMRIQHTIDDETQTLLDELFKQNLNISQTAKELFMHRNTLIYRLDKIRKSTGLDATCFDDAVTLRLILALARLNYKD